MADESAFRESLGRFATGVTVVAAEAGGARHGMTANAFTSVSLDPLLVLVCVDRRAHMHTVLAESGRFAATLLAHDQQHLSTWFSSPRPPGKEFDGIDWAPAPVTRSPVLAGGLGFVDCEVAEVFPGGDHSIFLAAVLDVGVCRDAQPLVYFQGAYRALEA